MRISSIGVGFLLAVCAIAPEAGAQSGVREGVKVKIHARGAPRVTGIVQSLTADSLVVYAEPGATRFAIARSVITELEISQGRSAGAGAKRGALWGLAAGAVGALGVMATATEVPDEQSPGVIAALVMAEFAGIGALIGAFVKAEQWDTVDVRPTVGFGRSGLSFGIALR